MASTSPSLLPWFFITQSKQILNCVLDGFIGIKARVGNCSFWKTFPGKAKRWRQIKRVGRLVTLLAELWTLIMVLNFESPLLYKWGRKILILHFKISFYLKFPPLHFRRRRGGSHVGEEEATECKWIWRLFCNFSYFNKYF